jgi:hypothetical protein
MLCVTDNVSRNIFHIQTECGESFLKYCQSGRIYYGRPYMHIGTSCSLSTEPCITNIKRLQQQKYTYLS